MEIFRKLGSTDGITVYNPDQSGFSDKLIYNMMNTGNGVSSMHFIKKQELPIGSIFQKQIMVPSNIHGEFKVSKYMGINLFFDLPDIFVDDEEIKNIIKSINRFDNGTREFMGVFKGEGTFFFCY